MTLMLEAHFPIYERHIEPGVELCGCDDEWGLWAPTIKVLLDGMAHFVIIKLGGNRELEKRIENIQSVRAG